MILKGTIFSHEKFVYENGTTGKKYLILLNAPEKGDPYLVVKTTSQRKDKPTTPGCISEWSLFFIRAGRTFFPLDTWVQLYSLEAVDQEYAKSNPDIKIVGNLSQKMMDGIIECLLKTQKDDIPPYQMKLLKPSLDSRILELKKKWDKH